MFCFLFFNISKPMVRKRNFSNKKYSSHKIQCATFICDQIKVMPEPKAFCLTTSQLPLQSQGSNNSESQNFQSPSSKWPPASPGSIVAVQNLRSHLRLVEQNIPCDKIPRWYVCIISLRSTYLEYNLKAIKFPHAASPN